MTRRRRNWRRSCAAAVRRRLCGEVPLSCYISGGLDSTVILGLSSQEKRRADPFVHHQLDSAPVRRTSGARRRSRPDYLGSKLTTVTVTPADLVNHFPHVILGARVRCWTRPASARCYWPRANREAGNIVALTGEGADEGLAGYVWFKWHIFQYRALQVRPIHLPDAAEHRPVVADRRRQGASPAVLRHRRRPHRQQIAWEFMAQSREYLYTPQMWQRLDGYSAYDDITAPSGSAAGIP